jgi:hypothetical protein
VYPCHCSARRIYRCGSPIRAAQLQVNSRRNSRHGLGCDHRRGDSDARLAGRLDLLEFAPQLGDRGPQFLVFARQQLESCGAMNRGRDASTLRTASEAAERLTTRDMQSVAANRVSQKIPVGARRWSLRQPSALRPCLA